MSIPGLGWRSRSRSVLSVCSNLTDGGAACRVDLMPSVGFSKHGQMERRPKGIVRFASAHEAQRAYRQRHAKLWRLGSGGQDEIHDIGPPRMWYLRLVQ